MYCSFCGRKLPDNEFCTCCRAVTAHNLNPGSGRNVSLFQTGTEEQFDHAHKTPYVTNQYGKLDSCKYGGSDSHSPQKSYSYKSSSGSRVINKKEKKDNSPAWIVLFIIVFFFIILSALLD
ncbi:MAG: hypothetical protein PUB67_01075 [Clostridiales bacterium]|nr:hypothetical protein [Clostridiales bacterium]